jgi:hypothetical protein
VLLLKACRRSDELGDRTSQANSVHRDQRSRPSATDITIHSYFDFDPDFDDLRRGNPEISRGAFSRTGARPPLPRAATARALSALPLSSPWLGVSGPFGKSHPTRPVKALYPTLLTLFEPISALMTFPLGGI